MEMARGEPLPGRPVTFPVRGPRKADAIAHHVKEDLPRAAEPTEHPQGGADGLPHATVGIPLQAGLAGPQIADRHRDPVFAALRFRLDPLDEPTTHQRQLELAHRALEAEEQAIVEDAWIVDAIEIDDPRAHEPTELEHVMPVPPVACEARGFEAEHGTHRPLTQLRHERLEARPRHQSAGGSPKVVIDPPRVRPT